LGPSLFGLPYCLGRIQYHHQHEKGGLAGVVAAASDSSRLEYAAEIDPDASFHPCEAGSRAEFLMERYTAFTANGSKRRLFRVWHEPWPQTEIDVSMFDISLLAKRWPWFKDARLAGANYSPGAQGVWMGRPHALPQGKSIEGKMEKGDGQQPSPRRASETIEPAAHEAPRRG
jgi:uncharacterized protein YqjF (DUF2071 family)